MMKLESGLVTRSIIKKINCTVDRSKLGNLSLLDVLRLKNCKLNCTPDQRLTCVTDTRTAYGFYCINDYNHIIVKKTNYNLLLNGTMLPSYDYSRVL